MKIYEECQRERLLPNERPEHVTVEQFIDEGLRKRVGIGQTPELPKDYVVFRILTGMRPSRLHNKILDCPKHGPYGETDDGPTNLDRGAKKMFADCWKVLKKTYVMDKDKLITRRPKSGDALPSSPKVVTNNRKEAMMVKKSKTTWDVVGCDADVRVIEARATECDVIVKSYEEAKAVALEKLKSHIRPYLARIDELESDHFLKRGALPPMRAWREQYGKRLVVTAKTKKRAAELVDETKHGFNTDWYEQFGDPWCDLAQREAVWIPQCDANGATTDKFQRCLMRDEATEILREYARPYRDVDPRDLLPLLDNKRTDKGTTEDGVAYEITTEAWRDPYNSAVMTVQFRICDDSGIIWLPPIVFEREFPKEAVEWKGEGF